MTPEFRWVVCAANCIRGVGTIPRSTTLTPELQPCNEGPGQNRARKPAVTSDQQLADARIKRLAADALTDQFNIVRVQLLINDASNVIRSEDGLRRRLKGWLDLVSHAAFGFKVKCHQDIRWLGFGWMWFLLKVFGDQVKHQPRDAQLAAGAKSLLAIPCAVTVTSSLLKVSVA